LAGSIGKFFMDRIDATMSSRASQASVDGLPSDPLQATDPRLNNLDAPVSGRASQASVSALPDITAIGAEMTQALHDENVTATRMAKIDGLATPADIPTPTAIATAVWDVLASGLTLAGSIGKFFMDRIDATMSSRASQASVDALPNTMQIGASLEEIEGSTVLAKAAQVAQVPDAVMAQAVDGGFSLKHVLRLILAFVGGKRTGGGTGIIKFFSPGGKARITLAVDAKGNCDAPQLDASDG
jgi:hypothetical protein